MGWLGKLFTSEIISVGAVEATRIASDPNTRPYWDDRHLNYSPPAPLEVVYIDKTDLYLLGWSDDRY